MSPLDYIKEGIVEGNWDTVCEGYEKLTGESLAPPAECDAQKAILRIKDIISATIGWEVAPEPSKPATKKRKKTTKRKSTKKDVSETDEDDIVNLSEDKRTSVQPVVGTTQFITNEPDPDEVTVNLQKAKKARMKKRPKARAAKTYNVECNECGCSFESNRPSGEMGQKCSECLSAKKSRFG